MKIVIWVHLIYWAKKLMGKSFTIKKGMIFLDLAKQLDEKTFMGKSYANMPVISGKINSGAIVTLFNNKCINNHTNVGQTQRICFRSDYLIWSSKVQRNAQFNELACILKNAFA